MRNRLVSSSPTIVFARALLVGLAAAAVVAAFALTRRPAPQPIARGVVYVCPMHPAVTAAAPGACPICRMALEPQAAKPAGARAEAASLTLPPHVSLRGFDAVSRVKPFESSFEMRAWAWAETREVGVALYPRDHRQLLRPGEAGLFLPESGPRGPQPQGIEVHLLDEAPVRWDAATDLVRFRVDAGAGAQLTPKEIGSVKLATRLREDLVVRESAIVQSPQGPYVLVASADRRTLTKRPVEIGSTLYGYAAILSGVHEDEYAAAQHVFTLDTERKLGRRAAR